MDRTTLGDLAGYLDRDQAGPYASLTVERLDQTVIPSEPHPVDAHRLLFIREGRATIVIDFETYDCPPGTLLYTRPGQVQHIPVNAHGEAPWPDALEVRFTGSSPARFAIRVPNVIDDAFGTRHWQLTDDERVVLDRSFTELSDEYQRNTTDETGVAGEITRLLLATLLLRITRLASAKQSNTVVLASQTYQRFRTELETSFAEIRTTNEYARRLGYSARTLNRACIEESGHTAKELIDVRITLEAKRLLTYTRLPVAAIASELGFSEPTNFGKFFARMTAGMPPGDFRKTRQGLWR